MNQPLIQVTDLTASYDGRPVLHRVNLTVYPRDFLGIIGPNGGGKTTLLRCLLGLHRPDSGSIRFFRQGEEVPSLHLGYLPQLNRLDRHFPITVRQVILSGLCSRSPLYARPDRAAREQVREIVSRLGLEKVEHSPIGSLSGGQLQRTLLGRALVSRPEVLLLDEPDTWLDRRFESLLYRELQEVNRSCAILLVSHDVGTVLQNVRSIACVHGDLHYHPANEVSADWLEAHFGCPIQLLGHGDLPHRVLKSHPHEEHPED